MAEESSLLDRFLAWLRSLFGAEPGGDTPPPPPPPGAEGVGDCLRLLQYTQQFGGPGGAAVWMRQIQHQGGREGFQSGGFIGAIVGGITGTGKMIQRFEQCKRDLGAAYQEAVDAHKASVEALKTTRDACKARCMDLPAGGGARRNCKEACQRAYRDAISGVRGGGAGDEWAGTFLP